MAHQEDARIRWLKRKLEDLSKLLYCRRSGLEKNGLLGKGLRIRETASSKISGGPLDAGAGSSGRSGIWISVYANWGSHMGRLAIPWEKMIDGHTVGSET